MITINHLAFQLVHGNILIIATHNRVRYSPYLDEVIISGTAKHPRIVFVP
jgi:hypothetical protein